MIHAEHAKHIFHGLIFMLIMMKLHIIERKLSLLEKILHK